MNVCNIGIVLWETFAILSAFRISLNGRVCLYRFGSFYQIHHHISVWTPNKSYHRGHFFSLIVDKPLWLRKGIDILGNLKKKHLHAVLGHVWLGQLVPCSRIPSPKFILWLFLYDKAILKGVLRVRVFEISK